MYVCACVCVCRNTQCLCVAKCKVRASTVRTRIIVRKGYRLSCFSLISKWGKLRPIVNLGKEFKIFVFAGRQAGPICAGRFLRVVPGEAAQRAGAAICNIIGPGSGWSKRTGGTY
jgi:hypothetical protein